MKNIKLLRNKGFTLVECVIAIAVFAVITVMVLMIMATTVQTQKKATDAEDDLNILVQNVVEDETNKKYGDDTKTLMMKVGSGGLGFSMTYSTVDGYKNYVICPSCNNKYNHTEFMSAAAYGSALYISDLNSATTSGDNSYIQHDASYWFDPSGMNYVCPDCGYMFVDQLECTACGKTGSMKDFSYDRFKGAYFCPDCGNGNVSQQGLLQTVAADSDFHISGMSANAIRYGEVAEPELEEAKLYMSLSGAANDTFRATLAYTPNSRVSLPGKYKLTIQNLNLADDEIGKLSIYLPPCYVCNVTGFSNNISSSSEASVIVKKSSNIQDSTKTSKLEIDGITHSGVGASFYIEFTLTNYESNNSFDYDYADKDTGSANKLAGYWFKGSNTMTYPR